MSRAATNSEGALSVDNPASNALETANLRINQQRGTNSANLPTSRRKIHIGSQTMNMPSDFSSNFIKTSKYTVINFVPLCLMAQFKRYANIYFFIIAILQSIPAVSPLNPFSAWAPLIVVIGLSMAREGYEDYQRYKSDIEMNSSLTRVFRNTKFNEVKWGEIKVGDILLVKENETFPADLIVINTSNLGGVCFIETSSLDGEKNYKNKEAVADSMRWVQPEKQQVVRLMGTISCIPPNENLHQFEGTITQSNQQLIVGAKQFLLRGAKLKNTKWIVGIIIYTGEDTKIMKNADKSRYKSSNIENTTNSFILAIFFFQLIVSIGSAIGNSVWNVNTNIDYIYIPDPASTTKEGFLVFLTYLVLNNTMIPISLIVSLEFVKIVQGYIISVDEELKQIEDGQLKTPRVYTTSINEELGQVQYIFSDKTGTLTCNKMELKLLCIGIHLYGDEKTLSEMSSPQKKKMALKIPTQIDISSQTVFYKPDKKLLLLLDGKDKSSDGNLALTPFQLYDSRGKNVLYSFTSQKQIAWDFFVLLATCHECVIEQKDKSEDDEELEDYQQKLQPNQAKLTTQQKDFGRSFNDKQRESQQNTMIQGPQTLRPMTVSFAHQSPAMSSQNLNSNHISFDLIKYQGPSPDETTLVDSARHYGFVFLGSNSNSIELEVRGQKTKIDLLKVFEFNSDRKRMSVIIRHEGLIKMYIKGADNVIKARLSKRFPQPFLEETQTKINEFSKKGLRTLLLAMKVIEEHEYEQINQRYQAAGNVHNREKLFFQIADDYENELYLLGATAVEDKLQDRVPETIRDLLLAKIKIWMLTGDKMETAENIAKSCKLIQPHFQTMLYSVTRLVSVADGQVYRVPEADIIKELMRLTQEEQKLSQKGTPKALLIEGEDLGDVLSTTLYQNMLIEIVQNCESVVCCRATPKQKAQVVKLVKEKLGKITLAIGDGANDVNMIQEAHIGVGLFGQEGMRAVQASDYALPEFKGLWRLLLVHGRQERGEFISSRNFCWISSDNCYWLNVTRRWNYIRISEMILYFFYKNFVFTIPQFFFSFSNGFSGQSIFDDYYITLYNIIFTAFPVVVRAITEQDLNYKISMSLVGTEQNTKLTVNSKLEKLYPKAYYVGQQDTIFNKKSFLLWLIQGLVHATIIYVVHSLSISNSAMNSLGYSPDLWVYSISIYSSIILVVDIKLLLHTKYITHLLLAAILFSSLGLYFLYIFAASLVQFFNVYSTASAVYSMPGYYLIIFFCACLVITFDCCYLYLKEIDYSGFVQHLRAAIKNKADLDNSDYMNRLEQIDITLKDGRFIPQTIPKNYQDQEQQLQ